MTFRRPKLQVCARFECDVPDLCVARDVCEEKLCHAEILCDEVVCAREILYVLTLCAHFLCLCVVFLNRILNDKIRFHLHSKSGLDYRTIPILETQHKIT